MKCSIRQFHDYVNIYNINGYKIKIVQIMVRNYYTIMFWYVNISLYSNLLTHPNAEHYYQPKSVIIPFFYY